MFNYLKRWKGEIGGLRVEQTAVPCGDDADLQVLTTFFCATSVHVGSSIVPFAEVEKLADDGFRLELARLHLAEKAASLQTAAELFTEALAKVAA